jgi:alkaline phosphatase D
MPDPDPTKTMLGDAQWQWLEETFRQPAQLRVVVSSIQLVASGHGWERWGLLPTEAQRFYSLVESTRAEGVVVLSGDRHIGAVYKMEDGHTSSTNGVVDGPYSVPYTIWDITSSALTHSFAGPDEPAGGTCVMGPDGVYPDASCDEAGPNRVGSLIHLNNLGVIDVDWEADNGQGNVTISLVKAERTPKAGFRNDAVRLLWTGQDRTGQDRYDRIDTLILIAATAILERS